MHKQLFLLVTIAGLLSFNNISAQEQFQISIQQSQALTHLPGVHSCAFAIQNGNWVFIGGRKNGLHGFQPYNGFYPAEMSDSIFVYDPLSDQLWSQPTNNFSDSVLHDCVIAAFNQYSQKDSMLYITGGYGFDITANDYITHPYLLAVNLNQLIDNVKNGNSVESDFRKLYNPEMAVTGGNMYRIDSVYYLVFGQKFDGRYSEIDTNGFFVQQYSNRIKQFTIADDGLNLSINNYTELTDTANFHRRDYNLSPQIFPDRTLGLTAFGGVFQYGINLPYFNPIDIKPSGINVSSNFNQNLNQYSTSLIPVYDSSSNAMHTIFMGGMSEYTFDTLSQQFLNDSLVPFVKTVSMITRFSDSTMVEYALPVQMPGYLGTNAMFIPANGINLYRDNIINLNTLSAGNHLLGYMISGIQSSDSNISQITSYMSFANNLAYEVYMDKLISTSVNQIPMPNDILNFKAFPNPFNNSLTIEFENSIRQKVRVTVCDASGKIITIIADEPFMSGKNYLEWNLPGGFNQTYFVKITTGRFTKILKVARLN